MEKVKFRNLKPGEFFLGYRRKNVLMKISGLVITDLNFDEWDYVNAITQDGRAIHFRDKRRPVERRGSFSKTKRKK